MNYKNFNLPTKPGARESPLKSRYRPVNKGVIRSQSTTLVANKNRNPLQVFPANNISSNRGHALNNQPNNLTSNTGTRSNSIIYSNNLYNNQRQQPNINQSNVSLYQRQNQQNAPNPRNYFTNPRPDRRVRANPSGNHNNISSFNDVNKSREQGGARRNQDNDNVSMHSKYSKYSTTSRNQLLRPVSINNDDHLFNLTNKEERLANMNKDLMNNFIKMVNNTKYNVLTNMGQNFKNRIGEIWNSYINDQKKNGNLRINENELDQDVKNINLQFIENLSIKTQNYIEILKERVYGDIFTHIDQKNNVKHYLDNDVKYLMETKYKQVKDRNSELKEKLMNSKNTYRTMIDQTSEKNDKLRETHMELYDREFCFKLNGDEKLVTDTLRNAIPSLRNKNMKLDEKLNYLNAKNDYRSINQLKSEIQDLEERLGRI